MPGLPATGGCDVECACQAAVDHDADLRRACERCGRTSGELIGARREVSCEPKPFAGGRPADARRAIGVAGACDVHTAVAVSIAEQISRLGIVVSHALGACVEVLGLQQHPGGVSGQGVVDVEGVGLEICDAGGIHHRACGDFDLEAGGEGRDVEAKRGAVAIETTERTADEADVADQKPRGGLAERAGDGEGAVHGGAGGGEDNLDRRGSAHGGSIDLGEISRELIHLRRGQRHAPMGAHRFDESGSAAIMKIRSGIPKAAQRGHIQAGEIAAESLAGGGSYGADIMEDIQRGIRETGTAMAGGAVELLEERLAGDGIGGERAVGISVRAVAGVGERVHIRGQRIEIRAASGIRPAERWMRRAGGDEAAACGEDTNLALKVLDLVEVARPVGGAVIGMPFEADVVAQTFAKAGEVPHPSIVAAVVVAGGAGDVLIKGEAPVAGIVEALFAVQDVGGEFLRGDAGERGGERGSRYSPVDEGGNIMNGDVAIHEVMHEKRAAFRRGHNGLRRTTGLETKHLAFVP